MLVICDNCGKQFKRRPSSVKNRKHKFCSRKCKADWDKKDPEVLSRLRQISKLGVAKVKEKLKGKPKPEWWKRKVSQARKGKPLTGRQKQQLVRLHALLRQTGGGRAKWCKLTEKEARELFEDYKKSHMDCRTWAKAKLGVDSFDAIRKVWRKYFPHEYEDFIELKMDRKTAAYARGRAFEWRVKRDLQGKGYWVLRSPCSAGVADLVAIKKGEILLVQCKTGGDMSVKEKDQLITLAKSVGAKAFFVHRGKAPQYALIYEELT
jgi:Holliday junction resolvase